MAASQNAFFSRPSGVSSAAAIIRHCRRTFSAKPGARVSGTRPGQAASRLPGACHEFAERVRWSVSASGPPFTALHVALRGRDRYCFRCAVRRRAMIRRSHASLARSGEAPLLLPRHHHQHRRRCWGSCDAGRGRSGTAEQFPRAHARRHGGPLSAALVIVGDRLGLYKALAEAGPMTAAALAGRTGTSERACPRMARGAGGIRLCRV